MKILKKEVVLYRRMIKNYELSDILIVDAFSVFGLDKLHVVSFLFCEMILKALLSQLTPLSIFAASPLAFFFSALSS